MKGVTMNAKKWSIAVCAVTAVVCGTGDISWGAKPKQPEIAALSGEAKTLESKYAAMLQQLKSEITQAMPKVNEQKKAAFLSAHKAEMAAVAGVEAAQGDFGALNKARGLIGHGNWWINDAKKQVAKAQADLKKATTDEQRAKLQKTIEEQTARQKAGEAEMIKRQENLKKEEVKADELNKKLAAAKAVLADAKAKSKTALEALNAKSFLASDALDAKLIKFQVLNTATPRGLAEFAAKGPEFEAMVNALLNDEKLMRQMVYADGPEAGKYGPAIEIYNAIQKASPKAASGELQRLAIGVSLAHAVPIKQSNPKDETGAPEFVDPVKRYLAFEQAYLANELDPAFKLLTEWDYRFVVDGDEPDETLAWGRQMLNNYRPDIVANPDYKWRYVQSVPTEVEYGSQNVKNDLPTLQPYQNMIMNGGVCGRRAFFGRFILRAFGIPTTARPQTGHAALVHWTPDGWVANLGGGWGAGWTKTIYGECADFHSVTQGRRLPDAYMQVQRAHWFGDATGEQRGFGFGKKPAKDFWNVLAIHHREGIITDSSWEKLGPAGEELGESNATVETKGVEVKLEEKDLKVTVGPNGVITIPAAATSKPGNRIKVMSSVLGGTQIHYSRGGGGQPFEYEFEAPAAGKYALTARVVVTSDQQTMSVSANGADKTEIAIPFTVGMWDTTAPVEVTLVAGKNVLSFSRGDKVKGLSIKDFTLTPVK